MRNRVIPVLQIDRYKRLVKTVSFRERTYVGDPFNVIRLFNEKEVDEICVLDIDATVDGREPDFDFVRELANECFMPLSYGGGLATLEHCEKLNRVGVEKFVLGHAALDRDLVRAVGRDLGSQALAACVDVAGRGSAARCRTRSGRHDTGRHPLEYCLELQDCGVGEIVLQSIDLDGARTGYDLDLVAEVAGKLDVPVVALGGAGEWQHLADGLCHGASAVASGSSFCFIGRRRAVLVSYPPAGSIDRLARRAGVATEALP